MATRQYIGARYVPAFKGTYDATIDYDALDVVDNGSGTSYIAKIPTPAGTPLSDTTHWAVYGAANGAIVQLQNDVQALQDNFAANKYFVTPEDYGAVPDGVTDCTAAIQNMLDDHPEDPIWFNNGTYLISDTLYCQKGIHWYMAPKAVIKLDSSSKLCMVYDNIADAQNDTSLRSYNSFLHGGVLDANGNAQVAFGYNYEIGMSIRDVKIQGFTSAGIYAGYNIDGASDVINGANLHDNLVIANDKAGAIPTTYGIRSDGNDNYYSNLSIQNCKIGLRTESGSALYNVHPYVQSGYFDGSIAFYLSGTNRIVSCVSDNCQTGFYFDTSGIMLADNIRIAHHDTVPFTEVQSAGGFQFFKVAAGQRPKIYINSVLYGIPNDYSSDGKFIDDEIYQDLGVYVYVRISHQITVGPVSSMANVIRPYNELSYEGVWIQSGADLNDFIYEGKWSVQTSAIGATITNKPTGAAFASTFTLIVEKTRGGYRQTCISGATNATTAVVAMRTINGSGNQATAWCYLNSTSDTLV